MGKTKAGSARKSRGRSPAAASPAAAARSLRGKESTWAGKKPAAPRERPGEPPLPPPEFRRFDLGAQRERWVKFQERQRLTCEEAARLLLDTFCSICTKKQNRHFIVPASHFKLLKGADNITTYTFNTHCAQHTFCKTCGVQSFYTPRSNPDGYGIAPHCLDEGTMRSTIVEEINGKEWEKAVKEHKTIRSMSKP
ncbi:Centromere protein V [Chelonia mydas]|uniref:Centromere protein V n=1 Tax=Chelonia mydas TaxID=8469 RepID=M7BKN2_CHEMY|nr:Centromere protein V [Chelonia mydas]